MKYIYTFLTLLCLLVWLALLSSPDKNFHLIACDVGQGDAMLLSYKNFQVVIDGGPNSKVLSCLSKYMPFWDKTIEVVILTHPEADHFTGLIDVFKNYKIKYFLANQVNNGTLSYSLLQNIVGGSQVSVINPTTGFNLRYDLIHLDILSPSQTFIEQEKNATSVSRDSKLGVFNTKRNLNEFSIIGLWEFGGFKALTTGDAPTEVLAKVLDKGVSNITLLKVPHHGSKTSLSKNLLDIFKPKLGVISVGARNLYHLPNEEVLNILKDDNVKVVRTDEVGDVEAITNGQAWWLK